MWHPSLQISFLLILLTVSCKAIKFNDRIITYYFIEEGKKRGETYGEYQRLPLVNDDFILINSSYFRNHHKPNVLLVKVIVDKKYGFENFGSAYSKEFGAFEFFVQNHQANKNFGHYMASIDLSALDPHERKERILKDTIVVRYGSIILKFNPYHP